MLRVGGTCAVGRVGSVSRTGAARLPRCLGIPLQTRSLSVASLQRGGPISLRASQQWAPGQARNFWSSSKPAAQPAPPPVVESTPIIEEAASSSSASVPVEVAVPDAVPVDTTPVSDALGGVTDAVASIPIDPSLLAPLQIGDLAALGIAGWSPTGLCAWGYEALQVYTGMPWFWTILGAGLLSRLLLAPLSVMTMQQSSRMQPHQDEINKLREDMQAAQKSKDPLLMQKAVLKQKALYQKMGVSMPLMITAPFLQLPVTLGMFFSIKHMCDLPVEQLKWSGLSFFPDLTIPDPTYILPIVATVAMNLQLTAGMKDMAATPAMPHLINLFRGLTLLGFAFTANLPAGVVVYITSSIIAMAIQSLILRQPAVRRKLGIAALQAGGGIKAAKMSESIAFARKWWKEKMEEAQRDAMKARGGRR